MARLRGLVPGEPALAAVLALGLLAGLVMIAADFFVVFSIKVGGTTCDAVASPDVSDFCATYGFERHAFALVLLGLFTLAMAWGATLGRSRPAGAALLIVGIVVLLIALVGDLPDARSEGVIGVRYESAKAAPSAGFYLELAGGALALAAGVLRIARRGS